MTWPIGRLNQITHRLSSPIAGLALLVAMPLVVACFSAEDRAHYHLERGREFVASGKLDAAKIELRSALSFDPGSFSANLELADLAEAEHDRQAAKFYLRDALAARPKHDDVAVRLGTLLRDERPWRARQLLLTVAARDPKNATAQLGLSQIELSIGRPDEALAIARRAVKLDPDVPGAYWQLGIVYEAILKQATLEGAPIDEAMRDGALAAFEGFIASGGVPQWKARLEQARILSAGSHNMTKALAAARRALESARAATGDEPKLHAAAHLANVARSQRDRAAYAEATETLLEVTPRNFRAWRNLAELREASGGSAEAVYQDLLALFPDDPEAQILYARHIGNSKGVWAAIRYFTEQIQLGVDPPQLLSALRSYQLTYHLAPQAARSLARLQAEHPENPWTALELAKQSAASGQTLAAIASLESLLLGHEISEAFEVLAKLERFHHRPKRAIRAARSAVEVKGYYEARLQRLLAETLFAGGEFAQYLDALEVIAGHDEVALEQQLEKARALYETGDGAAGRKLLLELIAEPSMTVAATIEFAQREGADKKQRQIARKLLLAAVAKHPESRELVTALVGVNLQSGRPDMALQLLDAVVVAQYPANVRQLRARLRVDSGNIAGALSDLDLALRADASLPGLIDFALVLYSKDANTQRHVKKIRNWVRAMRTKPMVEWLVNSRRIARLQLLQSRLLYAMGRISQAIAVLEAALSNYEYTIDTRIDLAYLLAYSGNDIDRAIEIARETASGAAPDPRALDTLGFAYLRAHEPQRAFRNFRLANQRATTPNPLFHYHESLALRELGRKDEALEAIDVVLALDPSFPKAEELRRSLLSSMSG